MKTMLDNLKVLLRREMKSNILGVYERHSLPGSHRDEQLYHTGIKQVTTGSWVSEGSRSKSCVYWFMLFSSRQDVEDGLDDAFSR